MENKYIHRDDVSAMTLAELGDSEVVIAHNSSCDPNGTGEIEHESGQNGKKRKIGGVDDEEDLQSVNLLLTQDEWSSSDDGEDDDDDDDDDFLGLRSKQAAPEKNDTTGKSRNADDKSHQVAFFCAHRNLLSNTVSRSIQNLLRVSSPSHREPRR